MNRILRNILPRRLRRLLVRGLTRTIFSRGLWLAAPLAQLLFGVRLHSAQKGIYHAAVPSAGVEIIVPFDSWGLLNEIYTLNLYERGFKVEKDDIVIDVGAHVGIFTVKAARAVGQGGLVIAIEPAPDNVELLRENVRINNLTNVVIVEEAVGDNKGEGKLYLSSKSYKHSTVMAATRYTEVKMDTLDNIISGLNLAKVNFIKIDIEGAELQALAGARRTLSLPGLKLAVAAYHQLPGDTEPTVAKVASCLKQKGMQVWTKEKSYVYAWRR